MTTSTTGTSKSASEPAVDTRTRLFYGFGSIAYGVKDNGFRGLLLIYYNQVLGLPAELVAAAIMIALVADAILDPIVGQVSDTWRSRWGRRHPFMYLAAVPSALAYLLLWNPPQEWSQSQLLIYLVVIAIIVRTFITLYEIPSTALVSEFTSDYDERTSLMSYRYLFFFLGSLALSVVTYRLLFIASAEYPVAQLNPASYVRYGWVAAMVILVSILVSAIGTHRWIPRLHQPPLLPHRTVMMVAREMLESVSHRSFVMILCAAVCKGMALGIAGSLALYMNTFFWELSAPQLAILVLDGFISVVLAVWLTPRLSRRFGKKPTIIWMFGMTYVIVALPQLLRVFGWFFENGSVWLVPALFLNGAIFGTLAIGSTILSGSMIADCVEEGQLRTGRRSEGLFFSANSLMQKAVGGVGVMAAGLILAWVGFPDQAVAGEVDQMVLDRLVLTIVPVSGLLYLIGTICLCLYDINRDRHEETLRQLDSRQQPVK